MKQYCDTSVLASLYLEDARTTKIVQWIEQEVSLPIPLSPLAELELLGAIQQQLFRKQITFQQALKCQHDIQDDIKSAFYTRCSFQGEEHAEALKLLKVHTSTIGSRTLDTLHVACALLLSVKQFVTCDIRQKLLAKAVGLKTIFF